MFEENGSEVLFVGWENDGGANYGASIKQFCGIYLVSAWDEGYDRPFTSIEDALGSDLLDGVAKRVFISSSVLEYDQLLRLASRTADYDNRGSVSINDVVFHATEEGQLIEQAVESPESRNS